MVGAHLERLFATHNKTNLMRFVVLQQSRLARPAFLPFAPYRFKSEELRAPEHQGRCDQKGCSKKSMRLDIGSERHVQLENYGLILFISLRHDLFCELDDRFKVGIMLILGLRQLSMSICITNAGCGRVEENEENADLWCQGIRAMVGHDER